MSHEQRFLTEGVHQDHPAVAVVAVGRGARLGQVVLGEKQRSRLSTLHLSPSTSTQGTPPNPPKVPECCGLWLWKARFGELVSPFVRQEEL